MLEQALIVGRDRRLGQQTVGAVHRFLDLVVTAQADRHAGHHTRRRPSRVLGRFGEVRDDVLPDVALVRHPQDRPVGALARQSQHHRAERRQKHRRRGDVGDVERVVHAERIILDVDHARSRERLLEHIEVGAQRRHRTVVGEAEHLVDHPVVRHTETKAQPALAHCLRGQRLLRQRDRMPRLHRHHRRADLDARGLDADDGRGGEGVELVGDLRNPHGGEPGILGPTGIGAEPFHLGAVAASLRAQHHADAHPNSLGGW